MSKKKPASFLERWLLGPESEEDARKAKQESVVLQPALRQMGTTDCPICGHEVAVYLTKTHRPFVNCGFCSVRIFYNGRQSIRLLMKKMQPIEDQ
jgi:DNA-directed RNA polymerase subunit RPC12/RpoP